MIRKMKTLFIKREQKRRSKTSDSLFFWTINDVTIFEPVSLSSGEIDLRSTPFFTHYATNQKTAFDPGHF